MSDSTESEKSDSEIIKDFQAGDNAVYTELIDRHFNKAYQIAFGILKRHEDAEEIVQDSFVKMHKVLHKFRGDSKFTTWMYRIVSNYAKNRYRWNKRRGAQSSFSIDAPLPGTEKESLSLELPGKEQNPRAQSSYNELHKAVYAKLELINPLYKEALILRNLEGLSYEEIAAILDCKMGTVKSRIARGREELRELLKKEDLL
jgi:RNA polymerase sigma-70 factor (ECF subfamily)